MKYVVIASDSAGDDEDEDDDYGWDESSYATVYRINDDGTKTEVGWIGGEPEDNNHYRDYAWIEGALNEAYELGVKDGANKEYNRLQDKV